MLHCLLIGCSFVRMGRSKLSDVEGSCALTLLEGGMTVELVADEVGVSRQTC